MKRSFELGSIVVFCIAVHASGCGYFARQPRFEPQSPAEKINPFEYSDEFSFSIPGITPKSQAPAQPSGPGAMGTISPAPRLERQPSSMSNNIVPSGNLLYRIQIGGVFDNKTEADRYVQSARLKSDRPLTVEYRAPFYRVFGSNILTQKEAEEYVRILQNNGFPDARWVPVTATTP